MVSNNVMDATSQQNNKKKLKFNKNQSTHNILHIFFDDIPDFRLVLDIFQSARFYAPLECR